MSIIVYISAEKALKIAMILHTTCKKRLRLRCRLARKEQRSRRIWQIQWSIGYRATKN